MTTPIMAIGEDVEEATEKLRRAANKIKQLDQTMVN
jgi:hypothetical protein